MDKATNGENQIVNKKQVTSKGQPAYISSVSGEITKNGKVQYENIHRDLPIFVLNPRR